jgi:phosphate-selective porin OprO/OprP
MSLLLLAALAAQAAEPAAKPDETPIEAYWKDGLRFRTKDGAFEGRIGGRFLGHVRTVFDRPDDELGGARRSVPDSAFVRQARLETEGTFYKEFGYKVQVDFGTGLYNQSTGAGPSNVSGTLRDGFVEWKRWTELQVRFGQFFEPVSQEDMCSTRFIDFVERSPLNRLMPGREIGLQFAGQLFDKRLSYFVMLANGNSLLNDAGRAVTDSNDEKELAALVRFSPFAGSDVDALRGLRFGLAGTVGSVDSVPAGTGAATAGFDLVSTELSILWLDSTAGLFDGRRTRVDPQVWWTWGPAGVSAEYLIREDELVDGSPESDLETRAFYAAATWILTGEDKKPEDRIVPKGEWGALELAVRFASVKVDDPSDAGLSAAVGNAEKMSSVTAGLNWWVRRNVRISANVVREKFDEEIPFDDRSEDTFTGLLFRAQVDF